MKDKEAIKKEFMKKLTHIAEMADPISAMIEYLKSVNWVSDLYVEGYNDGVKETTKMNIKDYKKDFFSAKKN